MSTVVAAVQPPPGDPFAPPRFPSLAWWLSPLEANGFRRLPIVSGELRDVFQLPGSDLVWAVGEGGLILQSADGGTTWRRQRLGPVDQPRKSSALDVRPAAAVDGDWMDARARVVPVAQAQQRFAATQPRLAAAQPEPERSAAAQPQQQQLAPEQDEQRQAPPGSAAQQRPPSAAPDRQAPNPPPWPQVEQRPSPPPRPERAQPSPPQKSGPPDREQNAEGNVRERSGRLDGAALDPRTITFSAVRFVDARRGWAVGTPGVVASTINGGQTWTIRAVSDRPLTVLHAHTDGKRLWVGGSAGILITTADGGATWRRLNPPTSNEVMHVWFAPDGARGRIIDRAGTVLATPDAGDTWSRVGQVAGGNVIAAYSDDAGRLWLSDSAGDVWHTGIGGTTFERQGGRVPAARAFFFVAGTDRGWAATESGTILFTNDGGKRWDDRSPRIRVPLRALRFSVDGRRGWAVGDAGAILVTRDGGRRWAPATLGPAQALTTVRFAPDDRSGFAVGSGGTILRTTDGGYAWDVVSPMTSERLTAVGVLDPRRVWAVGHNGSLLSTTGGGRTWTHHQLDREPRTPSDARDAAPTAVHFVDDARGWVITPRGVIFGTDNGGQTWTARQLRSSSADIRAAYGTSDGRVWAVGERDAFVMSVDGRWRKILDVSGRQTLRAIRFAPNGQIGSILGDRGIFVTRDGGERWKLVAENEQPLADVALADGGRGWAVGRNGVIYRTIDAGESWSRQASGTQADLASVHVSADGRRAWAAGDRGALLHTTDDGARWISPAPRTAVAPWYYASWLLVVALILPGLRRKPVEAPTASVDDALVADRPLEVGEPDPLRFAAIARGIAHFLRNENTKPPMTIAITGPWGSGKSSMMNLLKADLVPYGFRPVWFNAWHHQKEEHLLAALLENIRAQAIPPLFSVPGLSFRAKLLWLRAGRRRWAVLGLLFVFALSAGYFAADPSNRGRDAVGAGIRAVQWVRSTLPFLAADGAEAKPAGGAGAAASFLVLIASAAGLVRSLWKGLTAFGANPASLMATMSGVRLRDLEAKAGFRHAFAKEFRDVTRALSPRDMLILIDDLDRCRPDNVLEVLEAINFLVSSGDCFVVMGMELERVKRCVGLGFKDVADELVADLTPAAAGALSADTGRAKRAAFAQQYLEKLINIEVPIPVATAREAAAVMMEQRRPAHPPLGVLAELREQLAMAGRTLVPAALALGVMLTGFWYGLAVAPIGASSTALEPASGAVATAAQEAVSTTASSTPPTEAEKVRDVVVIPATAAPRSLALLPWPLVLLAAVGVWTLATRPSVVVRDSDEFTQALQVWYPVIFARSTTPRSAKKFLNRVRYYAMRQRVHEADTTWLGALLVRLRLRAALRTAPPAETIPERTLVALSALEYARPEWLGDERLFKNPVTFLREHGYPEDMAVTEDELGFPPDVARYRARFASLSMTVRT